MLGLGRKPACKLLPAEVRNKIRSDVVIPGLVQCVEELVYNSIDAQGSVITVIVNLNNWRLRVEDNGVGLAREDLEMVGKRYCTSKIKSADDLTDPGKQYGYRGEALASIIECSESVVINSKAFGRSACVRKFMKGRDVCGVSKMSEAKFKDRGFIIEIVNFMGLKPVRQQKRNDEAIEWNNLKEALDAISLVNPRVTIVLINDGSGARNVWRSCASNEDALTARIKQKQGVVPSSALIRIPVAMGKYWLDAVVSPGSHYKKDLQFLFVNRRYIPSSRVYKMISERISSVLGFSARYSTSSSVTMEDNNRRSNSPKVSSTSDRFPIFFVNVGVAFENHTISVSNNKWKVNFPDLDGLNEAINLLGENLKFKIMSQRNQRALQPKGSVGALNGRGPVSQNDSSLDPQKNNARTVAGALNLLDSKLAVQSRPAVRQRDTKDPHRLSYEGPLKKFRPGTHAENPRSREDSHSTSTSSDDDDESRQGSQPSNLRQPVIVKPKANNTHKLQGTSQFNIAGLKKRKAARESMVIPDPSPSAVATRRKKPRISDPPPPSKPQPEAALGSAPDDEEDPNYDIDAISVISKPMSRLSMREPIPSEVDVNSPIGSPPLDLYAVKTAVAAQFVERTNGPNYAKLAAAEIKAIQESNRKESQASRRRPCAEDLVTPAHAILKSQYTPIYMQNDPKPFSGQENLPQSRRKPRTSSSSSYSSRVEGEGFSKSGDSQDTVFSSASTIKANHARRCRNPSQLPQIPQHNVLADMQGERARGRMEPPGRQRGMRGDERRNGIYMDSQEYENNFGVRSDRVVSSQTRQSSQRSRQDMSTPMYGKIRTEKWVHDSDKVLNSALAMQLDPFNGSPIGQRTSHSSEDEFTQTQIPLSFSQQYEDGGRADHQRVELGLADVYETNSDVFDEEGTSHYFQHHANYRSSVNDEVYPDCETGRLDQSDVHGINTIIESPVKPFGFSTPAEFEPEDYQSSKYFAEIPEEVEVMRDVTDLEVENTGIANQESEVDRDFSTGDGENHCAGQKPEDPKDGADVENILLNLQGNTFRSTWLKKLYPEGASKIWSPNENRTRIPAFGNSELLNDPNCAVGLLVGNFMESEEDMTRAKWRDGCLQKSKFFETTDDPAQLPLLSLNTQEIQFVKKKVDGNPGACKFSKEELQTAVVIGQVDQKFIAAKVTLNPVDGSGQSREMLLLFDQHAVHERVRLEKLMKASYTEIEGGEKAIACTEVKPPIPLNFSDTQVSIMAKYSREFTLMGTTIEVIGPTSIRLTTVPTCFVQRISNEPKATREEAMENLLQELLQEKVESIIQTSGASGMMPKTILNVLKSQACKGAIKFNDSLTTDACSQLLDDLKKCRAPFQCAHGRPVLVPLIDLQ